MSLWSRYKARSWPYTGGVAIPPGAYKVKNKGEKLHLLFHFNFFKKSISLTPVEVSNNKTQSTELRAVFSSDLDLSGPQCLFMNGIPFPVLKFSHK